MEIGIALVGAGRFGRVLGAQVRATPGLRLVAITDRDPATAKLAGRELEVPVVASTGAAIEHPQATAVIVATSHASHAAAATAALEAGRHVFVEKPLAITVADCARVIATADRADRRLLVGHVMRLVPVVRAAMEILDSGRLGRPLGVWMLRHQPLTRTGWMAQRATFGNLLHSPAIHSLDLMNQILGRSRLIFAQAAPVIQSDVEYPDLEFVQVGYEGGPIGAMGATVSDPLYGPSGTNSARIVCERGSLAFDVGAGTIDVQVIGGPLSRTTITVADWGLTGAIQSELANFRDLVRGEAAPFVTPEEGLRAVELCEAADHSIATGAPVALPLPVPV